MISSFNQSNCANCKKTVTFHIVQREINGAQDPYIFVECSLCNTPVGILDRYNIGGQNMTLQETVNNLSSRFAKIEKSIAQILQALHVQ